MAEFKVGDKVVITARYENAPVGAKAKVVALRANHLGLDIDGFEDGHNLGRRLLGRRSGYWVALHCVKRLNEFKGNV